MSSFWWGVIGTTVGSALTLLGQWVKYLWETHQTREFDDDRKTLLRQMLDKPGPTGWRKMSTLSGVIGASRDDTARMLIALGARASETGEDVWAYIKDKPLPEAD
ncbi:MAG: hypothetical protein V4444_03290 [Pseudomonadota bacterium]